MGQDEPIYNIGVVARMTDIPAATLRVWERRYGFPDTSRTEGGHRLYSDSDIQRLLWVKAKTDEGMQVRQAVRALRALEEENAFPEPMTGEGVLVAGPSRLARAESDVADTYIARLQSRLYDALVRHDTALADDIFSEALALYPPGECDASDDPPHAQEIGEGWEREEVSIGTEHLATGYLR